MEPKRYPYSGKKKELAKPVQFKNPLKLIDHFTTSVLCTAKSNNPEHVRLVIKFMQTYRSSIRNIWQQLYWFHHKSFHIVQQHIRQKVY